MFVTVTRSHAEARRNHLAFALRSIAIALKLAGRLVVVLQRDQQTLEHAQRQKCNRKNHRDP
jgi:hypothetical protein